MQRSDKKNRYFLFQLEMFLELNRSWQAVRPNDTQLTQSSFITNNADVIVYLFMCAAIVDFIEEMVLAGCETKRHTVNTKCLYNK